MLIAVSAQTAFGTDSLSVSGRAAGKPVSTYQPSALLKKYLSSLTTADNGDSIKKGYQPFTNIGLSGYVRPYFQYRVMDAVRPGMVNNSTQSLAVNGYEINNQQAAGYQEPFLLLRLEGKPTSRVSFKVEYAFDNQLDGVSRIFNAQPIDGIVTPYSRRVSIYRLMQFQANAVTKYGTFNVIAGGGVNWYRLSPFTLWNYEYRDDMFERYPWEPENHAMTRYNSFYAVQNVARDARWGNTGTQGFILEAKSLPMGFGAVVLYGKTDNSGGFQSYLSQTPKNMFSGRIDKGLGNHKIGVNYFTQFGYYDPTALYKINQNIATADARINLDHVKIFTELGMGRYVENGSLTSTAYYTYFGKVSSGDTVVSFNNNWAPTASIQLDFDKDATFIPLTLNAYYVSKSVVNINSQIANTSNTHAQGTPANVNSPYDNTTLRGVVTDIGQMANNRMGGSLKHENTYGGLKVMVATSVTQEIENLYKTYSEAPYSMPNNTATFKGYVQSFNSISFQHRANQFARSRFGFYQNDLGPYNRVINMYRRSFETIAITDTGAAGMAYRKGYNSLDLNLKYKVPVFQRDLIVSSYSNYASVQDHASAVPLFSSKAFLRYFYTEFNAFYALHPKLTLTAFISMERALGNNRTVLADADGELIKDATTGIPVARADGKPIDQIGHGYGIGFDYDFAKRAGFYVRHRWFDHKDYNFTKDKFYGQETSVEFKIFF